jgi:hypothetical protein
LVLHLAANIAVGTENIESEDQNNIDKGTFNRPKETGCFTEGKISNGILSQIVHWYRDTTYCNRLY